MCGGWGSVLGPGRLCSPRPAHVPPPPDSTATRPVQLGSQSMRARKLRPRLRPLTHFCPGFRGAAGHQATVAGGGGWGVGSPRRGGLWGLPGPPRVPSANPKAICPLHTALPVSSSLLSGDLLATHWPRPQRDVTQFPVTLWELGDPELSLGRRLWIPQAQPQRPKEGAF